MASSATPPTSSTGWDALRAADWEAARAAFEAELTTEETAPALDGLARARWWLSDIPGAIEVWERAYVAYRRTGLDEPAAHAAVLLARERAGACRAGNRRSAERPRPRPGAGRPGPGRVAEIALGRIEEGMTRFDAGMAASAAGEAADLRTLGDLYCAANLAAEITLDVSRFGQWTGVVVGFMERTGHPDLLSFSGTCCAEVCRAAGQWEDGEGWLTRTLSQLQQSGQKARCVHPATRLASFRVAQGRLEEAEQLLRGYEDSPRPSRPWSPCTWLVARPRWRRPACTAA